MADETKEIKGVEKTNTGGEKKSENGCCSNNMHTGRIALIIIGIVLVLGALGAVSKGVFFNHRAKNNFGQFERLGAGRERGKNLAQVNAPIGSEGCPLHTGSTSVTISAISGDRLTVKTSSKDQIVNITADTSIIRNGEIAAKTDLKVDDKIVVKGTSNSAGELVATSIRVQPS